MITIEQCIMATASATAIPIHEITGLKRHKSIAHARHLAMYFARKVATEGGREPSYPELGRRFGWRDHTTVMAAVQKVEKLIVTNERVHAQVADINERLKKLAEFQTTRAA